MLLCGRPIVLPAQCSRSHFHRRHSAVGFRVGVPRRPSTARKLAQVQSSASESSSPLATATLIADRIMEAVSCDANKDLLLDFIPDEVLDFSIASTKKAGKAPKQLGFTDILDLVMHVEGAKLGMSLDSYAQRHLLWSSPAATQLLSRFMAGPDRCLHRYTVVSSTGERAVLTMTLHLQETLVPQYRMAPGIARTWRLRSISGEPDRPGGEEGEEGAGPEDGPHARAPSPALGPEMLVRAQLRALREGDVAGVYALASPSQRAASGPLEAFAALLQGPLYRPLLGHSRAVPLKRSQLSQGQYTELVAVTSSNTGTGRRVELQYLWDVRLQPPGSPEASACWLTHSLALLAAKEL